MIAISKERLAYLSRLLLEQMDQQQTIHLLKDRELVRQSILHVLTEEIRQHEERQLTVREKLLAEKDTPPPGSRAWEELFQRMLEEEYERHVFESL